MALNNADQTFVAPVKWTDNVSGAYASAAANLLSTSAASNAAVTPNSTSSGYTFLQIKREPCQVSEVTTSNHRPNYDQQQLTATCDQQQHQPDFCSATSTSIPGTAGSKALSTSMLTALVKIETPSPNLPELLDKCSVAAASGITENSSTAVPIGTSTRKRQQEAFGEPIFNGNSAAVYRIPLSQTFTKDLNCFGIRVSEIGGTGCGNIFFSGNGNLMTGSATAAADDLALQSANRTPTSWQNSSGTVPFQSLISMPPSTIGLQYSRDATRGGQVVLIPAATATTLDSFQPSAGAAALVWPTAYLSKNTAEAACTGETLQPPHNYTFPTMNTAHTTMPATFHSQPHATAASLQLFASGYLRNASEFLAAANKSSNNLQEDHLIAASANEGIMPSALSLPSTSVEKTKFTFQNPDKNAIIANTATNSVDSQSRPELNLFRIPTPPTSATIGEPPNVTSQLHATSQVLFQAASQAPVLLNLSATGPNSTSAASVQSRNNFMTTSSISGDTASNAFISNSALIVPAISVCDNSSATPKPLALTLKATTTVEDASNNSIVVNIPRGLTMVQPSATTSLPDVSKQPQMQDVNIQTDTPVCSEDESSTCPLVGLQQHVTQIAPLTAAPDDACLTPPEYFFPITENFYKVNEDNMKPLELTKPKNYLYDSVSRKDIGEILPQMTKSNAMYHKEKDDINNLNNKTNNSSDKIINNCYNTFINTSEKSDLHESGHEKKQNQHKENSQKNICSTTATEAPGEVQLTTDEFAGLELLSNISVGTLPDRADSAKVPRMLNIPSLIMDNMVRVKQEPPDEDQMQLQNFVLHNKSTKEGNNIHASEFLKSKEAAHRLDEELDTTRTPALVLEPESATAHLGGLNLLCALAEQRIHEEEEEQENILFAQSSKKLNSPTPSNHDASSQLVSVETQFPYRLEQSFPSLEMLKTSGIYGISEPTKTHVKRKKHKHFKSSKSSTASTSSTVELLNSAVSPSPLNTGKSSRRCSKKKKNKHCKEKKRHEAAASAILDFDCDGGKLEKELQNAFSTSTNKLSCNQGESPHFQWPSAQEIFNIMESRMRRRLADITRQYQKKKRKLNEISKTQRKRKKCSKVIAQQLKHHLHTQKHQQNKLISPATITALSLTNNTTAPLGDSKFSTTFTSVGSVGQGSTVTHTQYMHPSTFPLHFPPLSSCTSNNDMEVNSHICTKQNSLTYKPVRLEPSSLSAAIVANASAKSNRPIGNETVSDKNRTKYIIQTKGNGDNNYNCNSLQRKAEKHLSSETPVISLSKERKLMPQTKVNRRMLKKEKINEKKIKKKKSTKVSTELKFLENDTSQQHPICFKTDCKLMLTNEHLYQNEVRVLTDMGGLFYAGVMKPLQPPDIYAITLDGERNNKPHIMSREEIFKDTILEVVPTSINSVPVGTRLCAYWSQQYRCLYPGRAIESESSEDDPNAENDFVSVEFDDGDSGRIRLRNIRFLMSDYPVVEYHCKTVSLGKQKNTGIKNGTVELNNATLPQSCETKPVQSPESSDVFPNGSAVLFSSRRKKRASKTNFKMNLQESETSLRTSGNTGNSTKILTNDTIEQNRKHHKHKKHKKHKKHHRKEITPANKNLAAHTTENLNEFVGDIPEILQIQQGEQELSREQEVSNGKYPLVKPIKLESNKKRGCITIKTEQLGIEEESESNMMLENCCETNGGEDNETEHHNSKGSKIAAFLPEQQLWGWHGTAYRKGGVKGRFRKKFYKSIERGKELITVGDCAVFLSTGRPDRPYIGRIESMWETSSKNKVVRVRWFYHPEETTGCPKLKYPGALFESPHEDENDVQTISHRCEVLQFECYIAKFGADTKYYHSIYDNNDTYYLAGYYNPKLKALKLQESIPTSIVNSAILSYENPIGVTKPKGGEKA